MTIAVRVKATLQWFAYDSLLGYDSHLASEVARGSQKHVVCQSFWCQMSSVAVQKQLVSRVLVLETNSGWVDKTGHMGIGVLILKLPLSAVVHCAKSAYCHR